MSIIKNKDQQLPSLHVINRLPSKYETQFQDSVIHTPRIGISVSPVNTKLKSISVNQQKQHLSHHISQRSSLLPPNLESPRESYLSLKPQYYNRWYIKPNQRFIQQKKEKNFIDEIQKNHELYSKGPVYIYNQLSNPEEVNKDPFHIPSKRSREKSQRTKKIDKEKVMAEIKQKSGVLKMFIEDLQRKKQRIPLFFQNQQLHFN